MRYLVPAPGALVRDPVSRQPLPPEGAWKADDEYWRRRIADGDVTEQADPAAASDKKGK
jgi:hypothetical protein